MASQASQALHENVQQSGSIAPPNAVFAYPLLNVLYLNHTKLPMDVGVLPQAARHRLALCLARRPASAHYRCAQVAPQWDVSTLSLPASRAAVRSASQILVLGSVPVQRAHQRHPLQASPPARTACEDAAPVYAALPSPDAHAQMVGLSKVLGVPHTQLVTMAQRQPALMAFAPATLNLTLEALASALGVDAYHVVQAATGDPALLVSPMLGKARAGELSALLGVSPAAVSALVRREPAILAKPPADHEKQLTALSLVLQLPPPEARAAAAAQPALLLAPPARLEAQVAALAAALAAPVPEAARAAVRLPVILTLPPGLIASRVRLLAELLDLLEQPASSPAAASRPADTPTSHGTKSPDGGGSGSSKSSSGRAGVTAAPGGAGGLSAAGRVLLRQPDLLLLREDSLRATIDARCIALHELPRTMVLRMAAEQPELLTARNTAGIVESKWRMLVGLCRQCAAWEAQLAAAQPAQLASWVLAPHGAFARLRYLLFQHSQRQSQGGGGAVLALDVVLNMTDNAFRARFRDFDHWLARN